MMMMKFLLLAVPLSIAAEVLHWSSATVFIASCMAIIPLAMYMGIATEEIAHVVGYQWGGFLNATFGNATELIIAFFALKAGLYDVVKASLAGSVMGNILLVLGASMFAGGLRHKVQTFNVDLVEVSSSMLTFGAIGLCVPAIFLRSVGTGTLDSWRYEPLSLLIAVIMLGIYLLKMYFSFGSHREFYRQEEENGGEFEGQWGVRKAIVVLLATTIIIAVESEFLVASIIPVTQEWGISEFFVGIILIPIVGNAAEHSTAIWMAMKNKMDVAIEIAVGSSLQILLFVMPLLVILGALIDRTMSIVFIDVEVASILVAVWIANRVAGDGQSNWLEGVQLMAVYLLIGICFYWL